MSTLEIEDIEDDLVKMKSIDGKTTLRDLMAKLNSNENDLVEDIKLLYDTRWLKFIPSQDKIFNRLKNEL